MPILRRTFAALALFGGVVAAAPQVCAQSTISLLWGDVNNDGLVNIIDAQQIARYSVGLSVADTASLLGRGDVTADGLVNIIDAQQLARYSVGLSAPSRVGTPQTIVTVGTWTSIGPHHIPGGGHLASGKLQALAIFSGDPNIMYAGGGLGSGNEGPLTGAGAFKTTDGGAHWTPINTGLVDPIVNVLWVDQTNSNLVLAGTEVGGIFKSADGGQTWALTGNVGATSEIVSANGKVFAATTLGVAQSTDTGTSWSIVQPTSSRVLALAAGGGAMIAGQLNGSVLMQATPSASWQTVATNVNRQVWSVAIDPLSPATAYAVLGYHPSTLVTTPDGGVTWSTLSVPCVAQVAPSQALLMSSAHTLYVGCNSSMTSTSNAGQSWTSIPNAFWDIRRVFAVPGQSTLIVGSDQGLHQTSNGGANWQDISAGVYASILTGLAVHGSTILTAVQDFSPILSFDGGSSWLQGSGGEDGTVVISPGNSNYCYSYTTGGYLYSIDGCHTFQFVAASGLSGGVTYVQPGGTDMIAVDLLTPSTVYVASQSGVFKSTDFGVTMNPTGWPITLPIAIAVDPSDSKTIYVGTTSTLYRTRDGGATWATLSLAGASGFPGSIAVNPVNPQVVLVGLSNGPGRGGGVLRSADRGNTFHLVNTGLSTILRNFGPIEMLSLRFNANAIVALATTTGVYVSADLGDHWQDVKANAVPTTFTDVTWDGGYLYTATFGQGVLRAPVTLVPTAAVRNRRP